MFRKLYKLEMNQICLNKGETEVDRWPEGPEVRLLLLQRMQGNSSNNDNVIIKMGA